MKAVVIKHPKKDIARVIVCPETLSHPSLTGDEELLIALQDELEALRPLADLGKLVHSKFVSGNKVPVERCTITLAELDLIRKVRP